MTRFLVVMSDEEEDLRVGSRDYAKPRWLSDYLDDESNILESGVEGVISKTRTTCPVGGVVGCVSGIAIIATSAFAGDVPVAIFVQETIVSRVGGIVHIGHLIAVGGLFFCWINNNVV